jgi:hypothetical protein
LVSISRKVNQQIFEEGSEIIWKNFTGFLLQEKILQVSCYKSIVFCLQVKYYFYTVLPYENLTGFLLIFTISCDYPFSYLFMYSVRKCQITSEFPIVRPWSQKPKK